MLKNIALVIPTHGRVHKQTTLNALPTALRKQVTLVSSLPAEAAELRTLYPDTEVVVAKKATGIAEKRHWIMQNVRRGAARIIFMLDDDLAFFERCQLKHRVWNGSGYQLAPKAPAGTSLMMRLYPDRDATKLVSSFEEVDKRVGQNAAVGMFGIADRRHSDKVKDAWKWNSRMMYAFGVDHAEYKRLKVRFDAVKCREDFHVVLSFLRAGIPNHVYVDLLVNAYGIFGSPGGCADERTIALSDAQCYVLQKLHPEFVKVVAKEYIGDTPSRTEVVVAWKKAYESGIA